MQSSPTPETDDISLLAERWNALMLKLRDEYKAKVSLEGILFLIGVRELGANPKTKFEKEEKHALMHIALCAVLAPSGYYKLDHLDQDGWPHWEELKPLPPYDLFSQEIFLKSHILDYFDGIWNLSPLE